MVNRARCLWLLVPVAIFFFGLYLIASTKIPQSINGGAPNFYIPPFILLGVFLTFFGLAGFVISLIVIRVRVKRARAAQF